MNDYVSGSLAIMLIDYIESRRDETFELPIEIDYHEYIKSDDWKIKSSLAKQRAGYRCQICNGTDRLETHHRTYIHLGNEQPGDLIVLCHECHELFSRNGKLCTT